jgi:hypothetical protein
MTSFASFADQQTIMPPDPNESLVEQFVEAFEDASKTRISKERRFEVPFERAGGARRLDLLLRVERPDEDLFLAVEMIREGYPRDVRNAAWQLEEYRLASEHGSSIVPVVLAEHLSSGARESLRERNVAYFDTSGSLYLNHGQWLINIERAAKPAPPRRAGSLFTGAREQVVHALLLSKQEWLTGQDLATSAQTSTFTVSLTMQELERMEWTESQGSGRHLRRRLAQPGKLLDAWSEAWRKRKESRSRWYLYTPNSNNMLLAITDKLERARLSGWAFTGTAAANMLAPLLTNVDTAEVIIPPGHTDRYAEALALKKADKGSNVILLERSGASTLFCREHDEFPSWFASPFIQYLDLQDDRGRNKELAAHLRETILRV